MTTTTSAPNREINEILDENRLQGLIAKNKVAVFAFLGLLVAAVIGFGIFKMNADKSRAEYNNKIHSFETTVLKDYLANPTAANAAKSLESGVMNLHLEMGEYIGLLPVIIKASDALMNNAHNSEARSILSVGEKIASDDYAQYFIMSRQAAVLEDLSDDVGAIAVLEKMSSLSLKIFEGKTYLDLGRLYLKKGDKEKAKKSFTHVVEKAKDEAEFVKIAQLYLSKL